MRILILPLMLLAAACSPVTDEMPAPSAADEASAADQTPPLPTAAERQACATRGGRMQQAGMLGHYLCIIPFSDGGKRCTDGDQCLGDCMSVSAPSSPQSAVEGVCQADSNRFGCHARIINGKAEPTLCVD